MVRPSADNTPEVLYHLAKEVERLEATRAQLDRDCADRHKEAMSAARKNDRRLVIIETRNALWGLLAGAIAGAVVSWLASNIRIG